MLASRIQKNAEKLVGLHAKIYKRIASHGGPMTPAMIARRVGRTSEHVSNILGILARRKFLRRVKRGLYQIRS